MTVTVMTLVTVFMGVAVAVTIVVTIHASTAEPYLGSTAAIRSEGNHHSHSFS